MGFIGSLFGKKISKEEARAHRIEKCQDSLIGIMNDPLPKLIEEIKFNQFENIGGLWAGIKFAVGSWNGIIDNSPSSELSEVSNKISEKIKLTGHFQLFSLDSERTSLLKFNQQMMIDKDYILHLLNQYSDLLVEEYNRICS